MIRLGKIARWGSAWGPLALVGWLAAFDAPTPAPLTPAPAPLTAEQDHRRLLDLLQINELRPGRNGWDATAPNAANFDEAKVDKNIRLPDLLRTQFDVKVKKPETWWNVRRPELIELLSREMYGRVPATAPVVTWKVLSDTQGVEGGIPVRVQLLSGEMSSPQRPDLTVAIEAILTRPLTTEQPAIPAVIDLAFRWPPDRTPPAPMGPSAKELVIGRGWAYVEYVPTSVQPDSGNDLSRGVIGLAAGNSYRGLEDWGALRAWAWGASRVFDFLEQDPGIQARSVAIAGLSRYGKAALVAMAYDQRFAAGLVGSSGEGGASLMRRDFGETVENLAGSGEYHWFAGNFLKYAGPLSADDLPFDAHALIALVAPRPLLIGSGTIDRGDGWVDPRGMFLATSAASPVYTLLGARGLISTDMPPPETGLMGGELAFRQHGAGHTNGPNWPVFLSFAARYFN